MLGIQLLQNAPDEVLVMASSTLCNLLLEFSPSKEVGSTILKKKEMFLHLQYWESLFLVCFVQPILESGVIELLCSLTQSNSLALKVNGIWALMVRKVTRSSLALLLSSVVFVFITLTNNHSEKGWLRLAVFELLLAIIYSLVTLCDQQHALLSCQLLAIRSIWISHIGALSVYLFCLSFVCAWYVFFDRPNMYVVTMTLSNQLPP